MAGLLQVVSIIPAKALGYNLIREATEQVRCWFMLQEYYKHCSKTPASCQVATASFACPK